jgi:hypothetical protein
MGAIVAKGGCNEYSTLKGDTIAFQVTKGYKTLWIFSFTK